ncbi:protein ABCI7, chloroplastic [Gastrolobium bilobum]|uniref:protein ABCI7, chloroplastic n=1 Tax=Gastrolobium bilobum TaxID=150636 RepID=UPI002AB1B612|nr:protein ABCI7, chloroplastic [Gastrolobium bilobum]
MKMSGIALGFTPTAYNPRIPSLKSQKITTTKTRVSVSVSVSVQPQQAFTSDPFVLELAETLEDSVPTPLPLQKLRDSSSETLLSTPWPSRKDESFRFTDVSFIRHSRILPVSSDPSPLSAVPSDTHFPSLTIVDGHLVQSTANLSEFPKGVYVGTLSGLASTPMMEKVSELMCGFNGGDLFWSINGIGAPDLTVVYVPEGCRVEKPIHLGYFSMEGSKEGSNTMRVSNPRVLVVVEKGGEVDIIEEFSTMEGNENECYWTNAALEAVIGEGAKLRHSYIQAQSSSAAHIKWTSVRQESSSTYELTEVSTGGKLGRHNLHIQQLGPDTVTELSTLHLSVGDQTQDLHSRLVLDHPRGYSRQLHKCIVTHSLGQAVFDGNIKVNRYAQQTDAGQLTRSLLLEPRATVNVKPNLQIVADDVKCSHGAAISDLEESQLLYFQARGIDSKTARRVLIFAFGGEVIERIPYSSIRERVRSQIKNLLDPSPN